MEHFASMQQQGGNSHLTNTPVGRSNHSTSTPGGYGQSTRTPGGSRGDMSGLNFSHGGNISGGNLAGLGTPGSARGSGRTGFQTGVLSPGLNYSNYSNVQRRL
jgi:hypothetical protein